MTKISSTALLLMLATWSTGLRAEAWHCKNDIEVRCGPKSCSVPEGDNFTPGSVSFSSNGKFSVCFYSGCWKGKGKVVSNEPFLIISQKQVDWSDPYRKIEGREDILIAVNSTDRIAVGKAGGFALPMRCHKEGKAQ